MLVLSSNGLSSRELLERIPLDTGSRKTAALVVTADPVYKEKNYHVPRCSKTLEALGLTVSIFDLDVQPAEDLLHFDVVEFIGGNPFYLLNAIRTRNAQQILREIADKQILMGWSAAAFVFGPSLDLVNRYSPEMNDLGLTDLRGLCLTDIEVLPHYSKFLSKFDDFEKTCKSYEQEHGVSVLRLNDGDGILINGNNAEICRCFREI